MAKIFQAYRGNVVPAPAKSVSPAPLADGRVGQPVFIVMDGMHACAMIEEIRGKDARVELLLPDASGVMHRTGSQSMVAVDRLMDAKTVAVSEQAQKVLAWDAQVELDIEGKFKVIRSGDETSPIVDYKDVILEGYLSTFVGTTPADRDGDYVKEGAFKDTLSKFSQNPVMLLDHTNKTSHLAGSFEKIGTNAKGLAVRGRLSNAPGLIDIRFKVAEGHLKSLSMGGLFHYDMDGRGINKVDLFEGSLTPVPANQDALFQVRSLTIVDAAKAMHLFYRK